MTRRVDLHLHTFHSDGTFAPAEVIRRARALGLSAVSITDHDSVAGLAEAREAARQKEGGQARQKEGGQDGGSVEFFPGVELTVQFRERELHVLGYGFRQEDPGFEALLREKQAARRDRIQAMIERLGAHGICVTRQEVQEVVGPGESVGRPHLAEVLVRRGVVSSLDEAFQRYLGDHAPCFVKKATWSVSEAVQWIRQAGGVSVLAHPYRLVEEAWLPELVAGGIQGIEAYHSDHPPEAVNRYLQLAKTHRLLVTGGSDCHGFRKSKGPLIGSVAVPYRCFEQLKAAVR